MGKLKGAKSILSEIQGIVKEYNAAEKAGNIEAALEKNEQLKEAIRTGVNSPKMPRAKPLTKLEIEAHAERMAPQVAGELTRKDKGAQTIAGKTQQQFKREKTLPVNLEVMEGKVDPRLELPYMTLEDQKGGVLMGLPGDPTLARMNLKGIGDVEFERPVGLHGGPRYGDDEKLWASNLSAASNFLNASQRASQQYGNAPVYASFMKMPSGFGFAQHYLDSLLQYQRPDLLPKDMLEKLNEEIRKGYIKDKKKVTFPEFAGFENPELLQEQTLKDSNLRKHIASRLEASKKSYGLRPAEDVQFAVSHPELTNLETGAGGFTIGEVNHLDPLTESAHPTYSHDIAGKSLGQTKYATPYDLLYRDQLQLIKENPRSPEFNTLKLLGARQKIDDQLINELNEYQERMRQLIGKKDGGEVHMGKGGLLNKGAQALEEAYKASQATDTGRSAIADALKQLDQPRMGVWDGKKDFKDWKAEQEARMARELEERSKGNKMANGGQPRKYVPPSQLFPISKDYEPVARNRAGQIVENPNDIVTGAAEGLMNTLAGAARGRTIGTLGIAGDALESVNDLGTQLQDIHNANMPMPARFGTKKAPEPIRIPTSEDLDKMLPSAGDSQEAQIGQTFGELLPISPKEVAPIGRAVVKGAKELAPTAGKLAKEFAEKTQFGMPLELNVVPPSQAAGKAAEVKAPANDLGMYSVVEKAALNLQRKSGNGDAFLSDLMKNQGVSQAKLDETGLTAALKGRKGVTRDEVQQLAAEGKVPVQESVRRDVDNNELIQSLQSQNRTMEGGIENLKRDILNERDHPWNPARREKIETLKAEIAKNENKIEESRPALFKPEHYPEYSTRGGENYREIRIKLPKSDEKYKNFYQTNHHGSEANVLAHMRVADHVDAEGKKGLLIDELQSDWHQKGRDAGYKNDDSINKKIDELNETRRQIVMDRADFVNDPNKNQEYIDLMRQENDIVGEINSLLRKQENLVPEAPFKDDWYQLGLKRAIKEAADTGMDRVYLTTGDTQAKRYDLSQHIDRIDYNLNQDGTYNLSAIKNGSEVLAKESLSKKEVEDLVGKDVAKKISEGEGKAGMSADRWEPEGNDAEVPHYKSLSGLDLQVGGEGMRQYYDKTYLNWLKKYAKQHGAEVGITELTNATKTRADLSAMDMAKLMEKPEFKKILDEEFAKNNNGRQSWDAALKRFGGQKVYYLDLNPALKNTAKKGQAYADGGAVQSHDGFDYESHVNNIMNAHNAQNFDYEGHVNKILGMAAGGGLQSTEPAEGLAPYGLRHSGEGVKGHGFFGILPNAEGSHSSELSAEHPDIGEYPLLVPTLTQEEIDHLLSGKEPTDDIYFKAEEHAERRKKQGKSPFAQHDELRHPLPKKMADGGPADYNTNPDMSDGGLFVQAPPFKIGGQVQSIPR